MKYALIDTKRLLLPKEHTKGRCENAENFRLAKSIGKLGLISPIYVKTLVGGGYFEIISGCRRFCASRLAGIKKLPCFILEKGENPSHISITLDIWNKSDPFRLADRLKDELIKSGEPAEAVAERLGLDISDFIGLLTPTCMSELERRIATENLLSDKEIRRISSLSTREARLSALIASRKNSSAPEIHINSKNRKITPRRRIALSGLGFFENTLTRSIDILKKAGICAEKNVEEKSGEVRYIITIKPTAQKARLKL